MCVSAIVEGFLVDWRCLLKDFSSCEISDSRLLTDSGMFR